MRHFGLVCSVVMVFAIARFAGADTWFALLIAVAFVLLARLQEARRRYRDALEILVDYVGASAYSARASFQLLEQVDTKLSSICFKAWKGTPPTAFRLRQDDPRQIEARIEQVWKFAPISSVVHDGGRTFTAPELMDAWRAWLLVHNRTKIGSRILGFRQAPITAAS